MRKFRAIVETNKEPEDHEVLWYYKKVLYYYHNDGWEKFVADADIGIDNLPKDEILKLINDTITERFGNSDFDESVTNIVNRIINEKIGDFSPTAEKVSYSNSDYPSITNVKEALDELLYVAPKIISFSVKEAGIHENGERLDEFHFEWKTNKEKTQLRERILSVGNLSQHLSDEIDSPYIVKTTYVEYDTSVSIEIIDHKKNRDFMSLSIKFVDYIYYGSFKNNTYTKLGKIPSTSNSFNANIGDGENLWIFIPTSSNYKKIVFNEADSTSDFTNDSFTNVADTKVKVAGIRYVSKNASFGNITITLQK